MLGFATAMVEDAIVALFYICLKFVAVVVFAALYVIAFVLVVGLPFALLVAVARFLASLGGCRC